MQVRNGVDDNCAGGQVADKIPAIEPEVVRVAGDVEGLPQPVVMTAQTFNQGSGRWADCARGGGFCGVPKPEAPPPERKPARHGRGKVGEYAKS